MYYILLVYTYKNSSVCEKKSGAERGLDIWFAITVSFSVNVTHRRLVVTFDEVNIFLYDNKKKKHIGGLGPSLEHTCESLVKQVSSNVFI